ncbi:hypothetical protein ACJW8F_07520 [Plesiomonas shigelloides]|uniref:hypothetical protein n=1 Tax=Plesiomonas shigelloides TaxID=703 RepID=UPI00387F2152
MARPFAFNCAKERWFRAAKHHANKRKEYDFAVVAKLAMPKLSVAAEPTDWKENGISFAYTADTSTRPFANIVQEWKEY